MQDLVFSIKQALEAPLHIDFELNPAGAEDRIGDLIRMDPAPRIHGQISIEKGQDSLILVEGQIEGSFHVTCSRCLESAKVSTDDPFHLVLVPAPPLIRGEIELGPDDLDTVFYSGESFDLAPHVWDQVILSIPQQPLCSPDCRGIDIPDIPEDPGDLACESGFSVLKTLALKRPENDFPAST